MATGFSQRSAQFLAIGKVAKANGTSGPARPSFKSLYRVPKSVVKITAFMVKGSYQID